MQSKNRMFALAVGCLILCLAAASGAQQIRFENFSSIAGIQLNGSVHQANWQSQPVLRLTDGPAPIGKAEVAAAYFQEKQPVASGFTSWFEFQIHNPTVCCAPGDGIAFIIQNSTATDSSYGASGQGLTALGAGDGGLGYTGINNNLAIEFDILANPWDPNANHVAVQTCGPDTNTPVHLDGDYTIGNHHHVPKCLLNNSAINTTIPHMAGNCPGTVICTNGPVHTVVIEYTPPAGKQNSGRLQVWLDPALIPGTHTPQPDAPTVIDQQYDIAQLNLDGGSAWVGFTADQPTNGTAQDILGWEFTPHTASQVQKIIQNGGQPTMFPFGGHEMDVTYPQNYQNCNPNCISMTVVATPWNATTFYQQRLQGTNFSEESCVTYLQTGGNCIVYSVTCQDQNGNQVTCPTEPLNNLILIQSGFTTTDNITNSNGDFLEAEPIGSNNWCSIYTGYNPNDYDGVISGKGQGFSDIVATFNRNKPLSLCGH